MALVTGLTAEAMAAIRDGVVIDGHVDGSGHLILTTQGGTDIDAGNVIGPAGSNGTNGSDAPGKVFIPGTSNAEADTSSAYTQGITFSASNATIPWQFGTGATVNGTVITFKYATDNSRTIQIAVGNNGNMYKRATATANTWGAWTKAISTEPTATPYLYQQTLKFTSSGTFSKASYPWLRAIRVKVVGGGGGGGAAAIAGSGAHADGGGGGGGGYAESFITNISGLASSVAVTVGAGGLGTTGGGGAGGNGGSSSFGTAVVATGATGGAPGASTAVAVGNVGGIYGIGTAGDILISGSEGGTSTGNAGLGRSGQGGNSGLGYGGGGGGVYSGATAATVVGADGGQYGGGASGASNNTTAASATRGGSGADGIVLIELYA